ncbi:MULTISPECIES: hypothetical protein [unclassified Nocardioides]|uniref:hypothetical protein n=1 Tax=unclassified Nocardioides TaxID=2615069 RepID=UPI000AA39B54|nr:MULTISPECIES: hypothetical protein [unclassified Nocardioides]
MSSVGVTTRLLGPSLAVLLSASLLAGCSGSDAGSDSSSDKTGASSASASETPYLPVPDGVTLTPQGTHLEVGDQGIVAYEPRQDEVGVLDLTVTKLEQTTTKKTLAAWQLTDAQQKSTPYFVHVSVKNVGESDLGGRRVPLYVVNEANLLLESTPFASSFQACPSTALPKPFGPGATADVCLVYLAPNHGQLEAVSFRPEETFDPIIWTGEITKYVAPKPAKKKKKKSKGN